MQISEASNSQGLNLQFERHIYENIEVINVQKRCNNLVKPKKPIPSPRFFIENNRFDETLNENTVEPTSSNKYTGTIKKLFNRSSSKPNFPHQSQRTNDTAQTVQSLETLDEYCELTRKGSNGIFHFFKKIFKRTSEREHEEGAGAVNMAITPSFGKDQLRIKVEGNPPSYNDVMTGSNSENKHQIRQMCKRLSARIEGATASKYENSDMVFFLEYIDYAMGSDLLANMRTPLIPEKVSAEQTLSIQPKISSLKTEVLDEFDPCRVKWFDKLCAYFNDLPADDFMEKEFLSSESYSDEKKKP